MAHRTLAWRRAQRARTLARVEAWLRTHYTSPSRVSRDDYDAYVKNQARHRMTARQTCSGPCCGNPRKWFSERSQQELRADGALRVDIRFCDSTPQDDRD